MSASKPEPMTRRGRLGHGRRRAVRALVVLGAVLSFLAIFSVWVERQLLDTDDWVDTSAELIESEPIRTALSDYLVDELYTHVDMERELQEILPDAVEGLAGPAAGGIRQGAGQATERILETGTAQDLWAGANRAAHEELVNVLEGGDEEVQTEEGVVTLDLAGILRELAEQVGVGENLAEEIPEDAGQVVILRSDDLETAQDIARGIQGLALLLTLLAIGSFGLAVWLSRGQRWVALISSAAGMAAAGFAVLVLRQVAGDIVVDELVVDPGVRPAAEAAWSIGTDLLVGIATTVILLGAGLSLAAWLSSPAPSSRGTRRLLAPGLRDHLGWFYAGLTVLVGLLLLAGGVTGLRGLITLLVLALLAAFGLRELRRVSAVEFPDEPAWRVPESARDWLGALPSRIRSGRSDKGEVTPAPAGEPPAREAPTREAVSEAAAAETPTSPPPAQPESLDRRLERLERLSRVEQSGLLSPEELAAEKARILGEGGDGA